MYIYGNSAFMAELFFAKKLEKLCQTFCEATPKKKGREKSLDSQSKKKDINPVETVSVDTSTERAMSST